MIVEILPINISNDTRGTYYRTYSAYIATSARAAACLRVRMSGYSSSKHSNRASNDDRLLIIESGDPVTKASPLYILGR